MWNLLTLVLAFAIVYAIAMLLAEALTSSREDDDLHRPPWTWP